MFPLLLVVLLMRSAFAASLPRLSPLSTMLNINRPAATAAAKTDVGGTYRMYLL